MFLYHGTSTKHLDKILKKGILPRKKTNQKGQWDSKVESKPDFVYLTSAYPVYFALNAAMNDKADLAIIKVNIKEENLYPDEDFIARILWENDNREGELSDLNELVNLNDHKNLWKASLNYNGLASTKIVSPTQIIESKIISSQNWKLIMKIGGDSIPVPMNYKIMGNYYEDCINAFFKGGEKAALKINIEQAISVA